MADSSDSEKIPPDVEIKAAELTAPAREADRTTRRYPSSRVLSAADRDRLVKAARQIDFPTSLRGYDRAAVDAYVEKVTGLIAELEMSSSPEAAVRHALDEVSDETRDIPLRAHQTAEEVASRSRARADDRLQQAEQEAQGVCAAAQREADEMLDAAETRARELGRNAENVWRERRRLIEDMQAVGEQLVAIGEAESKRFARFIDDSRLPDEPVSDGGREPVPAPGAVRQT